MRGEKGLCRACPDLRKLSRAWERQSVNLAGIAQGLYGAKLARFFDVSRDLLPEGLHTFKFFLRPEKLHEFDFDIGAVNVAMGIEEMNFNHALGFFARNSRPASDIHDAVM